MRRQTGFSVCSVHAGPFVLQRVWKAEVASTSAFCLQCSLSEDCISPACLTWVFASLSETGFASGDFATVLLSPKLQLL